MNFAELGLPESLIAALQKEDISEPMPVQSAAIPTLLEGADAYVSAETGTGKTLAYLLPLFCRIDPKEPQAQAIVLAPTHELASQIHQQALRLGQHSGIPVKSLLLVGGANTSRQLEKLKKKPQLIVGSAGRVLELIRMKKLKVPKAATLVIDEADRFMAGEGLQAISEVVETLPGNRQLVFVSATESDEALARARRLSPNLVRLTAGANQINTDIEHAYFVAPAREKADLLRRLIRAVNPERAIVFVHKTSDAELVAAKMEHYNIPVADIHGTRGKLQRKQAMDDIRSGKAQVLIASDVAARGIDIKGVSHIFNFDAPTGSKDYLHRVGRTGRAGQKGFAFSLLTELEVRLVKRYESELGIHMHPAIIREGQIFSAEEE